MKESKNIRYILGESLQRKWMVFFVYWYIILHGLLKAKAILQG